VSGGDPGWTAAIAAASLEQINDGLIVVDGDWIVVYVNAVALELVERTAEQMTGERFWDVFPESYDHEFGIAYRKAMDNREEHRLEAYYGPLQGWFDVRAIPTNDGITFCFQNVNARRAAAEAQEVLVRSVMAVAESMTIDDVRRALDRAVLDVLGATVLDLVVLADDDTGDGTDLLLLPSAVRVPLLAAQQAVGSVTIAWDPTRDLDEHALRFLRLLGAQAGSAVERSRLLDRQRAIAETLQQAMLPTALPTIAGAEIAACYLPATAGLSVGGDWYDALELRDGRVIVAVGDVAGHGIEAAAAMGQVRNALRAYAVDGHRPGAILQRLDTLIAEAGQDLFTTAVVAEYEPSTGVVAVASAGHLPPIVWSGDDVRTLDLVVGAPIGVRGPNEFAETMVTLAPGDVLIAYTDGLVERRGEDIDRGLDRLRQIVAALPAREPSTTCESIVTEIVGDLRHDDICVLALRRT
jgi:serine phosphatase RsbU (regulator of sigma subunit)